MEKGGRTGGYKGGTYFFLKRPKWKAHAPSAPPSLAAHLIDHLIIYAYLGIDLHDCFEEMHNAEFSHD